LALRTGRLSLHVRKHPKNRLHLHCRRLVVRFHAQAISSENRQAEVHQPVITAEKRELVGSPHLVEVAASPGWRDQRDVNHAEGGGILEEQTQDVALIKEV